MCEGAILRLEYDKAALQFYLPALRIYSPALRNYLPALRNERFFLSFVWEKLRLGNENKYKNILYFPRLALSLSNFSKTIVLT